VPNPYSLIPVVIPAVCDPRRPAATYPRGSPCRLPSTLQSPGCCDRSAAHFDWNARGALAVGVDLEQAQRRVLIAQCRPADVKARRSAFQVNRAFHAQSGRAQLQWPIKSYVNGDRSVQYRRIILETCPGIIPLWVSIEAGWPIWMSRACVSAICSAAFICPAESPWHRRSRSHMLAHLQRNRHCASTPEIPGPHMKRFRLLLIEIQLSLACSTLVCAMPVGPQSPSRSRQAAARKASSARSTGQPYSSTRSKPGPKPHPACRGPHRSAPAAGPGYRKRSPARSDLFVHQRAIQSCLQALVIGLRTLQRRLRAEQLLFKLWIRSGPSRRCPA